MILRDYQEESVNSIFNYFESNSGNPCVGLPTGTGKSVVIAGFLQRVYQSYSNQKVLVLTHVKELIEQNYEKLITMWPQAPAGINSAGLKRRDVNHKVIFGGIGSVAKNPEQFGHVDLMMVDEAHLVSPDGSTMYNKFFDRLRDRNPHIKAIGMTATPWRMGHGHITDDGLFTDMCIDLTQYEAFNRFIAEGYLMPLVARSTENELVLDGVHIRGGEYKLDELQACIDQEHITRAALAEACDLGHDRKSWLVFASGVEHAINCARILNDFGIRAAAVHGKLSAGERERIIKAFKAGHYQALVNNNVLTTGFDHPALDMIVMLRPTMSTALWVQMLGRGTRPLFMRGFDIGTYQGRMEAIFHGGKKNCLVLDFAGNTKKLGPINDPVLPRKRGEKGGEAPFKLCPCCPVINHTKARFCGGVSKSAPEFDGASGCGTEFIFVPKIQQVASSQEIIKGDLPVVEVFKVDTITYAVHRKVGSPSSLRVSYHCGLRMFNEFVCLEHENNIVHKARKWWGERTDVPAPIKIADALEHASKLAAPSHIRVWTNQKYPQILAHCFDGTAFGTENPIIGAAPSVTVHEEKDSLVPEDVENKDNSWLLKEEIPF